MMRPRILSAARGFTLVETIIVIVMLGALGAIVGLFIRAPIQSYADSVARAEVSDQADLALRRIARDLRLALPNSVRVSPDGSAIEFLMTSTGGRYLAPDEEARGVPLDFLNPANRVFTVFGAKESFDRAEAGNFVVVFNLGEGFDQSDAYQPLRDSQPLNRNIAEIQTISRAGGNATITLRDNPFATQEVPMPSPTQRFQVVTGPVSYHCSTQADGTLALTRFSDYPIPVTIGAPPPGARRALVARRLATCPRIFERQTAASGRSALVVLALTLLPRNDGQTFIRLVHQVQVDNTP
jgi:MSHA biogenesis protein MshO